MEFSSSDFLFILPACDMGIVNRKWLLNKNAANNDSDDDDDDDNNNNKKTNLILNLSFLSNLTLDGQGRIQDFF